MAVNSKTNSAVYPGFYPKQETTTFGSVAPVSVTGFNAGDEYWVTSNGTSTGTVKAVYRFDAITSTWKLYPTGGAVPVLPALVPVLDILDTPPDTPTDQDSYIVKATATGDWAGHEGDIATWSNVDGKWVFYSPANADTTSVLTGDNIGTWSYISSTGTWTQASTTITTVETGTRPTWGNMAFITEDRIYRQNPNALLTVLNDQLYTWGLQVEGLSAGDNTNSNYFPRKLSWVDTNLSTTATKKVAGYVPKFTDGTYNSNMSFGLDHKGKLWWMGNVTLGTGATTTPDGTTVSPQAVYALVPIQYFQNKSIIISKVYTSPDKNNAPGRNTVALSNTGDLYVTGYNAQGQLGNGTTTNSNVWLKYPITDVKDVKLATTCMFVLTISGNLYITGYAYGWSGAAGNKTTPTLVATNVKDFDYCYTDAQSIIIAKNDNTLWTGGANAYGQLGKGNTTATTSITQVPGFTTVDKVYGSYYSGWTTSFVTSGKVLYMAGRNNSGILGVSTVAVGSNSTSYIQPTASFQGSVSKFISANRTNAVLTTSGQLWSAGNVPDRGLGSMSTAAADHNTWARVPLPGTCIDFRLYTDTSAQDGAVTLVQNMGFVGWGISHRWHPISNYGYGTVYIQNWLDNGIEITEPPKYIADVAGTLTAATPVAVTSIVDGGAGQTVTFSFTADAGTAGKLDFTGSTVTGTDTTQVSLLTTSTVLSAIGETISVSFTIDAADDPALVVPDTQDQSWVLELMVNGA